ncbi:hypothetical protein [Pseudomonas sp. FSL R10-2245]|uniref:hypothetical protein n=1 Tax=Pseudomonas sp. FSL R10-2245 TaxID=2662200 RepID=UPI002113E574|nr:hypothetical protein [Pseudomonas sp. FSL R10-2245]MDN5426770.1 hypothetical protein [Pseudomonadales bacterium]
MRLFSELIFNQEFGMGHLSLEDVYLDDVDKYGHMRVGMTDLYVKDNHAIYGAVTRGECRELTSMLLRDAAVQMIISAKLSALPEDYDPWISRIERNRALRARYGDKFDPWDDD